MAGSLIDARHTSLRGDGRAAGDAICRGRCRCATQGEATMSRSAVLRDERRDVVR